MNLIRFVIVIFFLQKIIFSFLPILFLIEKQTIKTYTDSCDLTEAHHWLN